MNELRQKHAQSPREKFELQGDTGRKYNHAKEEYIADIKRNNLSTNRRSKQLWLKKYYMITVTGVARRRGA